MLTPDLLRGQWPLVGRARERELAAGAITEGRPLVISGPGGAGKTRLLRSIAADAEARGWEIRSAIGTATAQGIPLGAVAHLVPASALDAPRDRVLRSIVAAIEDANAGTDRVLLCLDDSHLVDDASATLIAHLARHVSDRLGVVIVVRSGRSVPDALGGIAADDLTDRIDLGPLDESEVGDLLAAGLGAQVDPVTIRLLARWTRGNVLFLRELVRDGLDRSVLRFEHGVWTWHGPPTVGATLRELIDARHERLPDAARAALERVAIGEPVAADVIADLVDDADLDALEEAGLVERDLDDGRPVVRIGHPLHGESLRRTIPSARADRIRQELAEAIGRRGTRATDRLQQAILLADAGAPADPDALLAAGRRAWALRDTALVERLATAALRAGPNAEAEYLLGETLADGGDYEGALEAWIAILDEGAALADPLRVRIAIAAAAVLALTLHRGAEARTLLDAVESAVTSDDARQRIAASRAAFFLDGASGESAAAPPRSEQAQVLEWLGTARLALLDGRTDEVLGSADAITAVAERAGEEFPMADMFVGICRFFALMQAGDLPGAERFSERAREASLMDPLPIAPATWSQGLGIVAIARGNPADASTHLRAAAALLRGNDIGSLRHVLHELALARAMVGDRSGVAAAMAEAATANRGLIDPFVEEVRVDATLLAAEGQVSAAIELLRDALGARREPVGFYDVPILHDLARFGAAADALDGLEPFAVSFDGILAVLHRDHVAALAAADPDALAAVAERYGAAGYVLDAAESLTAAAALLRATPTGDRAATALDRRVDALLDACGPARPRTPMLAGRGPLQALTGREREVASLVAEGLTDNEIAERLVLSRRTVHAHLRAVYRKLGITNRADLRAALAGPDDRT